MNVARPSIVPIKRMCKLIDVMSTPQTTTAPSNTRSIVYFFSLTQTLLRQCDHENMINVVLSGPVTNVSNDYERNVLYNNLLQSTGQNRCNGKCI